MEPEQNQVAGRSARRWTRKARLLAGLAVLLPVSLLAVVVTNGGRPASPAEAQTATADVEVFDFGYTPDTLSSSAGESITVTVTNTGDRPHTFTIAGVADSGTIAPGETGTVTFTPSTAGTLAFFCTIHGADTMSGQLTVTAAEAPAAPAASPTQPAAEPTTAPAASPTPGSVMQPPRTGDGGLLGE